MDRPRARAVPSGLAPLLSDLQGEGDWWMALDALNASISLDAAFAPDVSELNHLSLSLLLSHEVAHVLRQHHTLRRRVRAGELTFEIGDGETRRPTTDAELCRAIEGDADLLAAYLVVVTLVRQVGSERSALPRGFVRLAYALTALLALFDPQRLSLLEYGDGSGIARTWTTCPTLHARPASPASMSAAPTLVLRSASARWGGSKPTS